MPSMNVSLTKELMEFVQKKVSTGMYNNASEVIRDALRRLDTDKELACELKLSRLKEALAPGIKQAKNGEFVNQSFNEIIAEVEKETWS